MADANRRKQMLKYKGTKIQTEFTWYKNVIQLMSKMQQELQMNLSAISKTNNEISIEA